MKQTKIYVPASDSAKVTLDVVIDSSGKCISATYVVDGSTTRDRNMIDVAKRRASELKYKTTGEMYTQRLIFDFTIVK